MSDNNSGLSALKYPTSDIFLAELVEITTAKGDMISMEHPLFTLSTKKPDMRPLEYMKNDIKVRIEPSGSGRANVNDQDLLLYIMGKLAQATKEGRPTSCKMNIKTHDFLTFCNRSKSNEGYAAFESMLSRLTGTTFKIYRTIKSDDKSDPDKVMDAESLLKNRYRVLSKSKGERDYPLEIEIELADWLYNSVTSGQNILTISQDYFRIKNPTNKQIYQRVRKHCGRQKRWFVRFKTLFEKTGSTGTFAKFKHKVKQGIENGTFNFLEYEAILKDDGIEFTRTGKFYDEFLNEEQSGNE